MTDLPSLTITSENGTTTVGLAAGTVRLEFRRDGAVILRSDGSPHLLQLPPAALRELRSRFNNLPTSALVDEPPEWIDGDIVLVSYARSGAQYVWTRADGVWQIWGKGASRDARLSDAEIEHKMRRQAEMRGDYVEGRTFRVIRRGGFDQ